MQFQFLRDTEWDPTFDWVKTIEEAANQINIHHEDYPKYVKATARELPKVANFASQVIDGSFLKAVHRAIFSDKHFAGKWRDMDVIVGQHRPVSKLRVADLMRQLGKAYNILDLDTLIEWYKDFETIHPFQDGNGRVGGVIVAAWAHNFYPLKGWLAPNQ